MDIKNCPIIEHYDDDASNLEVFFSNGKKQFWRFEEVKRKGIDKCIIFLPRDFNKLNKIYSKCKLIYHFKSASTFSPVYLYDDKFLVALCPLGGPASANLMEELIYVGVKYFLGVGSCGAVSPVCFDDLFVPKQAIRDEGVSYHYLPASRYINCSETLVEAVSKVLQEKQINYIYGITWTTDAIYRETPKRIAARIADGAIAVEMETASLAAVAKAKNVNYACLLYFTDYNNGTEWKTRFYNKFELRERLFMLAVEALEKI